MKKTAFKIRDGCVRHKLFCYWFDDSLFQQLKNMTEAVLDELKRAALI